MPFHKLWNNTIEKKDCSYKNKFYLLIITCFMYTLDYAPD